jgi:hypothetical protein
MTSWRRSKRPGIAQTRGSKPNIGFTVRSGTPPRTAPISASGEGRLKEHGARSRSTRDNSFAIRSKDATLSISAQRGEAPSAGAEPHRQTAGTVPPSITYSLP